MFNDRTKNEKILAFLIDANKIFTGIHLQQIPSVDERFMVKFQATNTNLFMSDSWWSPTNLFFQKLFDLVELHFGITNHNDINFNNTHTIFWFYI